MSIRVKQVHLRKSGKPLSLNHKAFGISLREVFSKTLFIQQTKCFIKIRNPQCKVDVIVVYCVFAAIGSSGVINKMQLRWSAS